jgi:hypothetical protein
VLTHVVRPRPRPLPYPRARRRRWLPPGPAGARWAALVGALAIATVAGVTWVAIGNQGSSRAAPVASSRSRAGQVGQLPPFSTSTATTGIVPTGAAEPAPLDAARAAAVLARLDKLRQRAFAQRRPALLEHVYVPGPLLREDKALLLRLVPAGCGLTGVRTTYDDVQLTARTTDTATVKVSVTLSDSLLSCRGTPKGRAPGSGPSTLHIGLTRHGSGYLISAIGP